MDRRLMRVLAGERLDPPPIWLMRQAGRYLAEYRATRAEAGSFLDLCYAPRLATEVTLQPIRRFGFDAAILFSDILVVPHALGQKVWFVEGEGPRLDPVEPGKFAASLGGGPLTLLDPVLEAVSMIRKALPAETTLLGFCGAPWTVATYMVAGRGTPDQGPARRAAYRDREGFAALIDRLVAASVTYLAAQLKAGADAVQIFDTWGGALPDGEFERWVVGPTRAIVEGVRAQVPGARIIGFPRGAGIRLGAYAAATGVDAVGLDWGAPVSLGAELQARLPVQGNLDPLVLAMGGRALDEAIDHILEGLAGGPHIFNLGHGILPETPIAHVERLVERVRRR